MMASRIILHALWFNVLYRESPAIGVIDAEPPEINDEDIEALADTTSDGTFLSAAATPTGDAAGFNV